MVLRSKSFVSDSRGLSPSEKVYRIFDFRIHGLNIFHSWFHDFICDFMISLVISWFQLWFHGFACDSMISCLILLLASSILSDSIWKPLILVAWFYDFRVWLVKISWLYFVISWFQVWFHDFNYRYDFMISGVISWFQLWFHDFSCDFMISLVILWFWFVFIAIIKFMNDVRNDNTPGLPRVHSVTAVAPPQCADVFYGRPLGDRNPITALTTFLS